MDNRIDYSGNQLGKYFLQQKLGCGSFGVVYKARDLVLQVDKAIKILEVEDPKRAYELFSEASIPYKCNHEYIIKINGGELIDFKGELLFVIDMEWIQGESIESRLNHSYISIVDSLCIIKKILFAVEFSHIKGVIHRDIKPANILLSTSNGTTIPKLSDFGLSTALGDVIKPWRWYVTHAAPETFVHDSIATVETDIFAIGMTLYRMVNNINDWEKIQSLSNFKSLIATGKLIDTLSFSPVVPDKVSWIIKKACHPSPSKRYQSAAEMRDAIERLHLGYSWNLVGDNHWIGVIRKKIGPQKESFILFKDLSKDVIVTNNGRTSNKDSKKFADLDSAKKYLMDYIKKTTLDV